MKLNFCPIGYLCLRSVLDPVSYHKINTTYFLLISSKYLKSQNENDLYEIAAFLYNGATIRRIQSQIYQNFTCFLSKLVIILLFNKDLHLFDSKKYHYFLWICFNYCLVLIKRKYSGTPLSEHLSLPHTSWFPNTFSATP